MNPFHLFSINRNIEFSNNYNNNQEELFSKNIDAEINVKTLNSRLKKFKLLNAYRIHVNRELLSDVVFQRTKYFTFNGVIIGIDDELFKSFHLLVHLILELIGFKQFIHSTVDNKWLKSLNADYNRNLSDLSNLADTLDAMKKNRRSI